MIQLPIVDQPPAVIAAGQKSNAVIVFSHNLGPDYQLIDPTKPGCAFIIETCYCPPNADGTPGDPRLEMYMQYQKAGTTGPDGIVRALMTRWNAVTGHVEASGLSAGVGGEVELCHHDGKPGTTATGKQILTARVDGVRVTGRLEQNGAPVIRALDMDAGGALIVGAGKTRFRIVAEPLPPLP